MPIKNLLIYKGILSREVFHYIFSLQFCMENIRTGYLVPIFRYLSARHGQSEYKLLKLRFCSFYNFVGEILQSLFIKSCLVIVQLGGCVAMSF